MDPKTLKSIFVQSTTHVLSVMAQSTATAGKPYIKKDDKALGDYSAYICANCTTSKGKGSIAASFTKQGAACVAASMLGEEVEDEQSLREVVGELVNIISGDARQRMASAGVVYDGSTPIMLHGEGHSIPHDTNAPIIVIPFKLPKGQCVVEFGFDI